jgi:replicative DNA helicase
LLSEDLPDLITEIWTSTDQPSELLVWSAHERTIRDRALRRKLKTAAIRISSMADDVQLENVVDKAKAEVDAVAAGESVKLTSMLADAQRVLAEHRTQVELVPSPWREMNDTLGGFGPGRMYVLGARPGVGKSAVASQIAYGLAERGPVVFATMEMDKGEVYSRIVSQQAGIYYGGMSGGLSEFMASREERWLSEQNRDIRVLDSGTQTVAGIRAAVRAASRDAPVAGVIVDYIHLLTTPTRIDNEANRIAELTRSLKQLAMDFKIPVVALSQLNREVTARDSGRPGLRDLRGSGSIEQDADVVVFLYRDGDDSAEANRVLSVYVAKNRHGASFVGFDLAWQGEFVRAVDL